MNKTVAESLDLASGLVRELKDVKEVDIAICPPFTALSEVSKAVIDSNIRLGAQNMSQNGYGAVSYTHLTLPPYWMRTALAVSASNSSANRLRMNACTSCACPAVAVLPVPMAQTGS